METLRLDGIDSEILFEKILGAIDHGATTQQIRQNPFKFLTSGKTKEIIINTGGEGLKVSREIVVEMARRGDPLATEIIKNNRFKHYSGLMLKEPMLFAYLETGGTFHDSYDRENKILIDMIKENKFRNNGGMSLAIYRVYEEPYMYQVCKSDDCWRSEYLVGWSQHIAVMRG